MKRSEKSLMAYPVDLLKRLPMLLEYLRLLRNKKRLYVSARRLAEDVAVSLDVLIDDVYCIGIPCDPDTDFAVNPLIDAIEIFLGFHKENLAFIIGSGSLAEAIIMQNLKGDTGLHIVAAFDDDDANQGRLINGVEVFALEKFNNLVARMHVEFGIIALNPVKAQHAADIMQESGIKVIWNLSGYPVKTYPHIILENTSISFDLAKLFKKIKEKELL